MTNTRNHITLQPAYVLHGKPYRDTSMLMEVFTLEHGRIGLVARGVRSAKSRLRGLLQPFRPLLISWHGKGDLGTLISAEANVDEGGAIGGSCGTPHLGVPHGGGSCASLRPPHLGILPGACLAGRALMSGFYLNELLLRLLHRHDPHPTLFHSYDLALRKLVLAVPVESVAFALPDVQRAWASRPMQDDVTLQQILRIFEKELLANIGYGLVLDHDVITGQPVLAEGMYRYHMQKGPERIASTHVVNTLGIVLHGQTLLGLAHNELRDAINLQEAKRLLRKMLAVHLGQQPLRSRALYSEMLAGSW